MVPRPWSGWKEATACGAWFVRRGDRHARRPKQPVRHCWCWACRIVGCGNRGSRGWPSLEVLRISPAPTAITSGRRKSCKTLHFQSVDKRAVLSRAVDNGPWRSVNNASYRPQESPANSNIQDGAGDAVGTLQRLSSTFSPYLPWSRRSRVQDGRCFSFL